MKRIDHRGILSIIIVAVFLLSLFGIDWHDGIWHSGGISVLNQIAHSIGSPRLIGRYLKKGILQYDDHLFLCTDLDLNCINIRYDTGYTCKRSYL